LHGLTFLALLLFSTPALFGTGQSVTGRLGPFVLALCVLIGLGAYGYRRIPAQAMPVIDGVRLRIMQPSVQQDQRFRAENREQILRHYRDLSDRATSPSVSGIADVTHLIWPESAFPFLLDQDRRALAGLAAFLPPGKTLISGAARSGALPGETQPLVYNAIQVIDDEGVIRDSYDKVHLVPFGEYLPMRRLLDRLGLRQFITVPGGFQAGTRRKALTVKGLPTISPMICYEAIFPDEALLPGTTRPGMLLNVTNDAWFGQTPGPYQHFAQSRMRAIEQGLPLVRAANSGISAIVDPYGRIIASLPLGATGVVDGSLPRGLENTLFSRIRHALFILMVVFSFGIVFLIQYRSWRSRV
jgi:apolipoprotein N-acyltransferase